MGEEVETIEVPIPIEEVFDDLGEVGEVEEVDDDDELVELPVWVVLGGGDQGGIPVRKGKEIHSPLLGNLLFTGSQVRELEVIGQRLRYELVTGAGPPTGWVTIGPKGK